MSESNSPLNGSIVLSVRNLVTSFKTEQGTVNAVDGVSFDLKAGQMLGLVGESGCGKSVTSMSILRLIASPPGKIIGGEILYGGRDLLKLPIESMQAIRGGDIAMIFQEPMTSLNPVHTVGAQVAETVCIHQKVSKKAGLARAVEMFKLVGIPSPEERIHDYPHQLSGGMRQRVMIAMALANNPKILIADEPTTALDVTIQAQILDLLKSLQKRLGMAVLLITHDLGVIAQTCDDVAVMYAGKIVERTSREELFRNPVHPYTQGLLGSIPKLEALHAYSSPRERPKLVAIPGIVPALTDLPTGCRFQTRCNFVVDRCRESEPDLQTSAGSNIEHLKACFVNS